MKQSVAACEHGGMDSISTWFIRDLWWKKWQWNMFRSQHFGCPYHCLSTHAP